MESPCIVIWVKRTSLAAYGSGCGTNLTDCQMVQELEDFLKAGYKTVKMKIASNFGADLDNDIRRIALAKDHRGQHWTGN